MASNPLFPGQTAAANLNPAEYQWFAQQRAQAQQQISYGMANLQRQLGIQNLSDQYDLADTQRQYDQARMKLPGSFIQRGLGHSGLYQYGLGDLADMRQQALDRLAMASAQHTGQFADQQFQLQDAYKQAIQNLQDQETATRLTKAGALPGYGTSF